MKRVTPGGAGQQVGRGIVSCCGENQHHTTGGPFGDFSECSLRTRCSGWSRDGHQSSVETENRKPPRRPTKGKWWDYSTSLFPMAQDMAFEKEVCIYVLLRANHCEILVSYIQCFLCMNILKVWKVIHKNVNSGCLWVMKLWINFHLFLFIEIF